ncbi:hypothetical protein [Virgibacillus sp. DJP39]|uniref:hypothetical protein n=1 Tax=Virgibacillus sp. DJP39 TaxID=3409790 RepID=UPI003BB5FAD4
MTKVIGERVIKNYIFANTKEGNYKVIFYGEDKQLFLEKEKESINKFLLLLVVEIVTDKTKSDNLSVNVRKYKNGELINNINKPFTSIVVYKIKDKIFPNFEDAHKYGLKHVEGYNYVDVARIERIEKRIIDHVLHDISIYEIWVEGKFITEFEDHTRARKECYKYKLARNTQRFKREEYEVYINDEKDFETEFRQDAYRRGLQLKEYLNSDKKITIKKVSVEIVGDGTFDEESLPEAPEKRFLLSN